MQLNSVVLPAPLGPTRPTLSPECASKHTLSTAVIPPNVLVTSFTLSRGSWSATVHHPRFRIDQRQGTVPVDRAPTGAAVGTEEGAAPRGRGIAGVEDKSLHSQGPAPLLEFEDPFRMGRILDGTEGKEHEDQAVATEASG